MVMKPVVQYEIPKEPGRWRAITLAVAVHGALLVMLWIGVRWQNDTPLVVEAEVWSPQVREAAPKPQPPPEPEPEDCDFPQWSARFAISRSAEVPSDGALAVVQVGTNNARGLLLPLVEQAYLLFRERVVRQ